MVHQPVLLDAALTQLAIKPYGVYVDATFGRGGHSRAILEKLGRDGRLFAIDRDLAAFQSDQASVLARDARFKLFHGCFSQLRAILEQENLTGRIDGVLLDLGVSSPQLDSAERGFSFLRNGPLDMRMGTNGPTAAEWLASVSESELTRVLFEYGEERYARRIAKALIAQREDSPVTTTRQLADLVIAASPYTERHKHPATRVFQAIRIAVNRELEELEAVLEQSIPVLRCSGRLVVISFHSLEDRIVKRFIRRESGNRVDPGRLPIKEDEIEKGRLIRIGPAIRASKSEIELNPRARSAVMRTAEKI